MEKKRLNQIKPGVILLILVGFVLLFAGCVSLIVSLSTIPAAQSDVTVTYLDTGQSNATLVQTAYDENILIDAGDVDSAESLIEALKAKGVKQIDLMILSHWHLDHTGAAVKIINEFDVKQAWVTDNLNTNKNTTNTLTAFDENGVEVSAPKAGESITFSDVTFTVVGPVEEYEDQNLSSLVVRMVHGKNGKFLFPGDSEVDSLNEMSESGVDLSTNVLLAAHHGSAYSLSDEFWEALGDDLEAVVVECGLDNQYGHPHKELLQYCEKHDIPLYRTDQDGQITIISRDDGIEVELSGK